MNDRKHFLTPALLRGVIPLYCVAAKDAHKIFFLSAFKDGGTQISLTQMLWIWLLLQVCFSYISGALSDRFGRKALLLITLVGSFLSIILIKNEFLWAALLIDGIFCNVTGIARAAYCDVHIASGRKPNIINTFIVQSIPWIFVPVIFLHLNLSGSYYFILALSLIAILSTIFLFEDFRDHRHKDGSEVLATIKKYARSPFPHVAIAFLMINTIWWGVLYYEEAHLSEIVLQKHFMLVLGLAFLGGCLLSKYLKFRTVPALFLSFIFVGLFFLFDWLFAFILDRPLIIGSSFFLHITIIGGVLIPNLYSLYGERAKTHEQGSVFGYLEGLQTFSEFTGALTLSLFSITGLSYKILLPACIVVIFFALALYKTYARERLERLTSK